jgi:hypothetical protein
MRPMRKPIALVALVIACGCAANPAPKTPFDLSDVELDCMSVGRWESQYTNEPGYDPKGCSVDQRLHNVEAVREEMRVLREAGERTTTTDTNLYPHQAPGAR